MSALLFDDITYEVAVSKQVNQVVVDAISGYVRAGEVLAVLFSVSFALGIPIPSLVSCTDAYVYVVVLC